MYLQNLQQWDVYLFINYYFFLGGGGFVLGWNYAGSTANASYSNHRQWTTLNLRDKNRTVYLFAFKSVKLKWKHLD